MFETLKIPKDSETLHKLEEISLKDEIPPLKLMEFENPTPVFRSFGEFLGGSVSDEALQLSEIPGNLENPEIKTVEFENPDFTTVEIENPCLDFPKPQESLGGSSPFQPPECGEIVVEEGGEKLEGSLITKTLDSVKVENSVSEIENSSLDSAQFGKSFVGSLEIEGGECSETLDELGDPKDGGNNLGDAKFSETQVESVKDESNDVEDDDDNKVSEPSSSDDNGADDLDDDVLSEKGVSLDRGIVPFIGSKQRDCHCLNCLREEMKRREEEEYNWRNHLNRLHYPHPPFYCRHCGCERVFFRDPLMKEPPCRCGDCNCSGDRIMLRDHPRRHGKKRHLLPGNGGEFEWYSYRDRFYGNGYGFLNMRRPWSEPEPEPCPVGAGLANLGNTCFLNSIMQCFTHTVVLVQGILSLKHEASSHGVGEFCVLCAVRDQIELSFMNSGRVIAPSNLVDNLSNISSYFRRYQQEDAHEFLQGILDKLDRNCSEYEAAANDSVDSSPSDTLVQRIFGGRLVSQVRCCKCGHSSDTPDPIIDLSLEIDEVDSLESALNSFTKVETLDDAEKIMCGSCEERVKAEKQLMLDQAPFVAAFHLKRFKSDGFCVEKIDTMVEYPLELDFTPYTKGSNDRNGDLKYELYAFVVHVGFSNTSGHYFCYIRTSPEEWYRFDDSKVTRVSEEFALQQEAYILFYTKKGTPWFGTLLDKWKEECHEKIWSTSPKSVLHVMELPSTSNPIGQSIRGCDPCGEEDAIHESSTALPSELGPRDEVEIEAGVGIGLHGSSHWDGSGDAFVGPASEAMQDKVGPMAGVDAWGSSVANLFPATSLSVPIRNDGVKKDEAQLDDTRAIKGKTHSKTIGEIRPVTGEILGIEHSTPLRAQSPTKFDGEPADGAYEIRHNHLTIKHKSSASVPAKKSSINANKQDTKRKEVARLCKSMPRGRGSFFMNLVSPLINNSSSRKRRKQASIFHHRQSPKKRVKVGQKRVVRPLTA